MLLYCSPLLEPMWGLGTITCSDKWRLVISLLLQLAPVNHSPRFVDPATGVHTQGEEGVCKLVQVHDERREIVAYFSWVHVALAIQWTSCIITHIAYPFSVIFVNHACHESINKQQTSGILKQLSRGKEVCTVCKYMCVFACVCGFVCSVYMRICVCVCVCARVCVAHVYPNKCSIVGPLLLLPVWRLQVLLCQQHAQEYTTSHTRLEISSRYS